MLVLSPKHTASNNALQRKIMYLQLVMITFLSPMEINSERTKAGAKGEKSKQVQNNEEETSLRLKKQLAIEKSTISDEDDEKKTLAQQVLDGKYGLIQTELFSSPVKRPGILSYEINPEVPKDNINNLGGLKPEEIWLAENHLLVLRGGGFTNNDEEGKVIWPPIDSYMAPQRQVKIPPNPKVPPPFPIQLTEGGPIEIIKGKTGNKTFQSYFRPSFKFQNHQNEPNEASESEKKQRQGNLTQGNRIPLFPFLPPGIELFPPAIAFLPPSENLTELDEDDPSIYYPPRYDFIYTKNYSTYVPPGPLVPGIILPPPPNFFAPLENKTRPKNINTGNKVINSSKKPSKNWLPETNRSRYKLPPHNSSFKPKSLPITPEQKFISSLEQTTNKNKNKIILSNLYLNKTSEEWVPIPAPRPFYITDINKLKVITVENQNHPFNYESPKNGWAFENTTEPGFPFENIKSEIYKDIRGNENTGMYHLSNQYLNEHFKAENSSQTSTAFQLYDATKNNEDKHVITNKKSKDIEQTIKVLVEHATTTSTSKPYYYNRHYFETNTLLPQIIYEDVTIKTPSMNGRILPPTIKYEEDYKNLKHTSKPLSFLYYEQEPKYQADGGGYFYEAPENSAVSSYKSEQFKIKTTIPTTKNKITTYRTTQKPPVYEYSFSAPGYGTIEAPKVGNNFETNSKAVIYDPNLKRIKKPEYTYYDYKSQQEQNKFNFQPTTVDLFYSTVLPPANIKNKYSNIDQYSTEKPYNSYNTPDMEFIDENTKKYFSLFGQKLNLEDAEITTSLPQTNQNTYPKPYYQNQEKVKQQSLTKPNKNIRFPEVYNVQSDRPYYTNEEYTTSTYANSNQQTRSKASSDKYSFFYGPSNIDLQAYREYEHELVRPNHPLHSDININYKIPSPTINPDAELIDPDYVSPLSFKDNSFVSYRLPGNGGHFYFLTPQTIQLRQNRNTKSVRYPDEEKSHFASRHKT